MQEGEGRVIGFEFSEMAQKKGEASGVLGEDDGQLGALSASH